MRIFIFFFCILVSSGNFYCQLIRPNFIYENVIKEVYDHYDNMCIVLLHATQDPIQGQGIRESGNLLNLQRFFSRAYIRTVIMSISTFVEQIGDSYHTMLRPLIVLLNDDDDLRQQFARKMAPWIDMAHPTWLIFFRKETSIESFFEDIYVQFDCTMMVTQPDGNLSSPGEIITEVYQINRGDKLRSSLLGTWNREMGIELSQLSLYQRRNNLQGHTLRVTSIEDPPQSMLIHDHNEAMIGLGGLFGQLMDLLQESMNCTILYQATSAWGMKYKNGSCCGAIGQLIANTTDIFAAAVPLHPRIMDNMISFTTPVYSTKFRVYIKRPAISTFNWTAYFVPFEKKVWIAIVVIIAITTMTISLMNSVISRFANHWKDNEKVPTRVSDIFLAVFGVFCNQGMVTSRRDPIRITHFVIQLTGVTIIAAYSAALISALAVETFVMPFTTIEGLLQDGTYSLAVVKSSAERYFFSQRHTDKIFGEIANKLKQNEKNYPDDYLDGLQRVCNEDKYAFMTRDIIVSQVQSHIGCTLVALDPIAQWSITLGLRPRSPYRGLINSRILMWKDSGVMEKLLLLHPNWVITEKNVDGDFDPVELHDILPLLILLLASVFMGLIIQSIEKLLKRNTKMIKKEKKIVKKFLKNIKPPATQINHLQRFYNWVSGINFPNKNLPEKICRKKFPRKKFSRKKFSLTKIPRKKIPPKKISPEKNSPPPKTTRGVIPPGAFYHSDVHVVPPLRPNFFEILEE